MISADTFAFALRRAGFRLFSGVPCSGFSGLIDTVIESPDWHYVAAANEGDAVAVACGAELGGLRSGVLCQNSGLGNAVNPLTSLSATFRIPLLLITTWRGEPGKADEAQHRLMGRMTPGLFQLMDIPFEHVPDDETALAAMVDRAVTHMDRCRTPYGLLLGPKTIAPSAPRNKSNGSKPTLSSAPLHALNGSRLDPDDVLQVVQGSLQEGDAVLATTGYTGRALYRLADRAQQLYNVGAMGCVSSIGLGLAKAQPQRRVIVIDGDGSALMRLGALATIGRECPPNLVHILLDNGLHESTGGQETASTSADLGGVARACGYPVVVRPANLTELQAVLVSAGRALSFIHVPTGPRTSPKLPRPHVEPPEVADRFRSWLGVSS